MAIRLISVLIIAFIISIVTGEETLGRFTRPNGTAHDLSSDPVIVKDDRTFIIPKLIYDGKGPDTYFMVGTGDPPVKNPVKTPGDKIPNENGNCEVLKAYKGETITLVLPSKYTVNNIDWLAVYCIHFKHTFGYVVITKPINVPTKDPKEKLPMDCSRNSPQLNVTEGKGYGSQPQLEATEEGRSEISTKASSGSRPQLQILLMASALTVLTIMKGFLKKTYIFWAPIQRTE